MRRPTAAPTVARMVTETTTSRALVELYLERIAERNDELRAYRSVFAERARAEADEADRRLAAGEHAPLLGMPIAVKENLDVEGEPTTHGTRLDRPMATADCEAVARLRAAGAVILGHTTMPELALWGHRTDAPAFGIARHPYDPQRSPGGSSGGSAIAVAAGMASAAIGTDGGGSVRVPAACCGLVGLKPQRDRVPLAPDDEHWLGLTVIGPIARTAEDAGLLLDVLAGRTGFHDAARSDPGELRVAVSTKPVLPCKPGAAQLRAVEETAALLRSIGCATSERDPDYGELRPLFTPRWARGAWEDAKRLEVGRGSTARARAGAARGAHAPPGKACPRRRGRARRAHQPGVRRRRRAAHADACRRPAAGAQLVAARLDPQPAGRHALGRVHDPLEPDRPARDQRAGRNRRRGTAARGAAGGAARRRGNAARPGGALGAGPQDTALVAATRSG